MQYEALVIPVQKQQVFPAVFHPVFPQFAELFQVTDAGVVQAVCVVQIPAFGSAVFFMFLGQGRQIIRLEIFELIGWYWIGSQDGYHCPCLAVDTARNPQYTGGVRSVWICPERL